MSYRWMILAGALALAADDGIAAQEHAALHQSDDVGPAPVRLSRVRLATGVELQVAETGPADGVPVLFLHGYPDSWHSFGPILERLPAGMRTIVPSQRGHGASERPDCCYGTPEFAADAFALLDELEIPRVAVVGHSMGSFIAQRMAIDDPNRISALVLIGSSDTFRSAGAMEFAAAVRTLEDPVPMELIREFQASSAAAPLPDDFLNRLVEESARVPARVWRDAWAGLLVTDAPDELHRITAPTLVVSGDRDELFPTPHQEALASAVPGARLLVYAETGHSPHWEHPDRFAADLTAFLSEVRAGRGAARQ